jgi:hypothetical protein
MKSNNVKCYSKGYGENFYHFLAQQLHGLYLHMLTNNFESLNFYYDGPYTKIIKETPFLNLFPLSQAPEDCVPIKPIGTLDKDENGHRKLVIYSDYLKSLFLPKIIKNENKKILIAQRANNRIIKNDDELFWALKPFGDTNILTLDSLSFLSQIEAIHNSKIIIAAHGAGLTHMLFASPGTIVIEVYSKGFHGYYPYKNMARILNLKWSSVDANYSSWEYYSAEDIKFIESYPTEADGKIDSKILLSREHKRLRELVRDPRYVRCDVTEVTEKIASLLAI